MATIPRKGLPEFWSTGLAKALVGENPCLYQLWIKSHFRIEKIDRSADFTQYKLDHTAQLKAATDRLTADGWKCQLEKYFRVNGSAAVLVGKADLITQKKDCRPVIRDVKSGKPRESDNVQVAIYQYAIPLSWNSPSMVFDGEVIYPTHTVKITPTEAQAIRPKLFALVKTLAIGQRPPAAPSPQTCKFCDVTKTDCPDRMDEDEPAVPVTSEF